MLFFEKHGTHAVLPSDSPNESARMKDGGVPLAKVAPGAKTGNLTESGLEAGLSGTDVQSFGYLFPDAEGVPGDGPEAVDALKALAAAMVEAGGDPGDANSDIPPIFTYFGQFIDHDITANTDREVEQPHAIPEMSGPVVPPQDRALVAGSILNLRNGSLRLDSLYGEGPTDTPFTIKVRNALRDPGDRAKMRTGGLAASPGDEITPPNDKRGDLPRLGDIIDDPASGLSEADIDALPDGPFKEGFKKDGAVKRARAVIGDGRNDENLLVAQLHLAFLRFHNAIADSLAGDIADADARFAEAKRRTILVYQWLVVNVYLPAVCEEAVVDGVKSAGAPLYKEFRSRVASAASELPLGFEFSVAAFRFGHSMVRAEYDHNSNFGEESTLLPAATFRQLFSFTGGDNLGEDAIGVRNERLPSNWVIDWSRFANPVGAKPNHSARSIDTKLAPPLSDMFKEDDSATELGRILRHLAERNLRRSHLLNIPSGQAVVAAINAFDADTTTPSVEAAVHCVSYKPTYSDKEPPTDDGGIALLPEDVLAEGEAGAALQSGGMLGATPLWYYCLRESEVTAGDKLGPVGSRIVAETLVGLVVEDDQSYWHEGSGDGSWTPSDAPVDGAAITDMPAMLRAAGVMA